MGDNSSAEAVTVGVGASASASDYSDTSCSGSSSTSSNHNIASADSAIALAIACEDAGRGFRTKRKFSADAAVCPVCKCTLRTADMAHHLSCELERLHKITAGKLPPTRNGGSTNNGTSKDSNDDDEAKSLEKQWHTYQQVRQNRHSRQRVKCQRRRPDENDNSRCSTSGKGTGSNTTPCPVCSDRFSVDAIAEHVEKCLRRSEGLDSESGDEEVDVEAFEEYEWAGQSRVRVTSLVEGGVSSLLGHNGTTTNGGGEDDDVDLVVDVDDEDRQRYGPAQYCEQDIIPPLSERDALRRAVLGAGDTSGGATPSKKKRKGASGHSTPRSSGSSSRPTAIVDNTSDDSSTSTSTTATTATYDLAVASDIDSAAAAVSEADVAAASPLTVRSTPVRIAINHQLVVEALRERIRELERQLARYCNNGRNVTATADGGAPTVTVGGDDVHKCLICLERYQTPVTSVCCWHVHCERCWLQTLGAKKLCPQCNMITSPADLRRIYM